MIRIALCDDHTLVRNAIARLLAREEDMAVVVEASDGGALLAALKNVSCDVVVLDVVMPGWSFSSLISEIRSLPDAPVVVVLTGSPEDRYVQEALAAGALAYVDKDLGWDDLVSAIRQASHHELFVSPRVARIMTSNRRPTAFALRPLLSRREKEVLSLMGLGYSARDLAAKLGISVKTVGSYRARLYQKVGVKSVSELVRYAVTKGYVN